MSTEDGREKGEADILAGDEERDAAGTLVFWQPVGDDAVVDGKGRRLERAEGETQAEDAGEGGDEAEQGGAERPEEDHAGVEEAWSDAVDEQRAGDLQRRVGPGEGGEDETEFDGREVQILADGGTGDRDAAAVHVIDDGRDKEEHDHEPADAGGGALRGCCDRTAGVGHGSRCLSEW